MAEEPKEKEKEKDKAPPAAQPAAAPDAKPAQAAPPKKSKDRKNVPYAVAHIQATFNNTVITISEPNGNVLVSGSSGAHGFKGSKKSTPFAAEVAGSNCGRKAAEMGVRTLEVLVKGPGAGREAAIRALQNAGLKVNSIRDVTPIPHNGCRPPKRRRV
jgi:small subunit ribosomal protein S11